MKQPGPFPLHPLALFFYWALPRSDHHLEQAPVVSSRHPTLRMPSMQSFHSYRPIGYGCHRSSPCFFTHAGHSLYRFATVIQYEKPFFSSDTFSVRFSGLFSSLFIPYRVFLAGNTVPVTEAHIEGNSLSFQRKHRLSCLSCFLMIPAYHRLKVLSRHILYFLKVFSLLFV